MRYVLNCHAFAQQVRDWIDGRPLRAVAADTGVSAPTLSRVTSGHRPDVDVFLTLCQRMEVDPMRFGLWLETEAEDEG